MNPNWRWDFIGIDPRLTVGITGIDGRLVMGFYRNRSTINGGNYWD